VSISPLSPTSSDRALVGSWDTFCQRRLATLTTLTTLTICPTRFHHWRWPSLSHERCSSPVMQDDACDRRAVSWRLILTLPAGGQRPDDIALPELVAMFRRAAPRGPCPDAIILAQYGFLHSVGWVRRWVRPETQPKRAWEHEEREVRKALNILTTALPPLIETYQKLVGLPPFGPARVAALLSLNDLLPAALTAIEPDFHRPKLTADWHAAAALIAAEAMEAWQQAGRTKFGQNPTSPLVRFTQEFLSRAGIEQDNATIAMAFQRGILGGRAKPPTTKKSES
jgi:hypothetical protein